MLRDGECVERARLERMTRAIAHRGPDGAGVWIADDGCVGFGHRRLSIIDLSPLGAQPMTSHSGRYVITFNGEIYNFAVLRAELERAGAAFRGHSDTEVILAACDSWGINATVRRLAGMFAMALWDTSERALYLVRDRAGIKPLYYAEHNGQLLFGSELRALIAWLGTVPPLSRTGLLEYLRLGYVPGPFSIFDGVKKLPPATILKFSNGRLDQPVLYWSLVSVIEQPVDESLSETAMLAALDAQLRRAVARHMVSDVPLGAFLSGGIDSSTVVALMQAQSSRPVRTFSIGFRESEYNEAHHAAAVAKSLGTDHTELYLTDADAREVIPALPDIYDEPFADTSQIPTFLVSRLARQHVTVALSGDGGDELFAGYNRYLFVANFWERLCWLPLATRRMLARLLGSVSPQQWDVAFKTLGAVLPGRLRAALPGQKMHKVVAILEADSLLALYRRIISQWGTPELILTYGAADGSDVEADLFPPLTGARHPVVQQMYWDMQTYLVDDLLTKVDRASMARGLEARVPFLDHSVIEFAWRIPLSMKLKDGVGKWILKRLLHQYVPEQIVDRPKMGFGVPVDQWLRGPLRDWAHDRLTPAAIRRHGLLNPELVANTWDEHARGVTDRGGALWTVLMLHMWLERVRQWV